jgi:hypothetical protein
MLIHDSFSAVGLTLAMLRTLVASGEFAYCGRSGSLAEYRRVRPRGRERFASALRQVAQLAWFARNVFVKVVIVLRLRRSWEWPY